MLTYALLVLVVLSLLANRRQATAPVTAPAATATAPTGAPVWRNGRVILPAVFGRGFTNVSVSPDGGVLTYFCDRKGRDLFEGAEDVVLDVLSDKSESGSKMFRLGYLSGSHVVLDDCWTQVLGLDFLPLEALESQGDAIGRQARYDAVKAAVERRGQLVPSATLIRKVREGTATDAERLAVEADPLPTDGSPIPGAF